MARHLHEALAAFHPQGCSAEWNPEEFRQEFLVAAQELGAPVHSIRAEIAQLVRHFMVEHPEFSPDEHFYDIERNHRHQHKKSLRRLQDSL